MGSADSHAAMLALSREPSTPPQPEGHRRRHGLGRHGRRPERQRARSSSHILVQHLTAAMTIQGRWICPSFAGPLIRTHQQITPRPTSPNDGQQHLEPASCRRRQCSAGAGRPRPRRRSPASPRRDGCGGRSRHRHSGGAALARWQIDDHAARPHCRPGWPTPWAFASPFRTRRHPALRTMNDPASAVSHARASQSNRQNELTAG